MKRYRILLMTHKDLVPPETIEGLTDKQVDQVRTEYNVYSTLYNMGHEVILVGVYDSLREVREKSAKPSRTLCSTYWRNSPVFPHTTLTWCRSWS